jgi:hypothetical protein
MVKSREQSLIIRNEQLACEILRIRSKYAIIKKEYSQFRALILTPKDVISAATQTCKEDFRVDCSSNVLFKKRASLRDTYNSPSPCNFGSLLKNRTPFVTPKSNRKSNQFPSVPPHETSPDVTTKDDTSKPSKFQSGRTQGGSSAVLVQSIDDDDNDTTLVHGVNLIFDDIVRELTPESGARGRPMKKVDRSFDAFASREEIPGRRRRETRTPIVSYREPKLNTKVRKGHKFFAVAE